MGKLRFHKWLDLCKDTTRVRIRWDWSKTLQTCPQPSFYHLVLLPSEMRLQAALTFYPGLCWILILGLSFETGPPQHRLPPWCFHSPPGAPAPSRYVLSPR